jgi:hypothetical protein
MEILQASSYAAKVGHPDITKDEPWEKYVMNILKTLRGADKSGWHHRMTARVCFPFHVLSVLYLTFVGRTSYI